jgi:hypothetical protein
MDELESLLFNSFIAAIRHTLRLVWALVRPILPDLTRSAFSLLRFPLTWTGALITALWVLTDHGLTASLVAVAAIVAAFVTALLRPGLR